MKFNTASLSIGKLDWPVLYVDFNIFQFLTFESGYWKSRYRDAFILSPIFNFFWLSYNPRAFFVWFSYFVNDKSRKMGANIILVCVLWK